MANILRSVFDPVRWLLAPPVFPGDREKTRVAESLHTILLVVLAGAILASPLIVSASSGRALTSRLIATLVLILMSLVLLGLTRSGRVHSAGVLTLIGVWAVANLAILVGGGGIRSLGFPGNIILVIMAGIIFGWRGGLRMAALVILTGIVFTFAQSAGFISQPAIADTDFDVLLIASIYLLCTAALLRLGLGGVDRALKLAYQEIQERRRAEEYLRTSENSYRRLAETSQRQAKELELLDRVRTAMAGTLDMPDLFRTVVEAVAQTFGYSLVSIYRVKDEAMVLEHQIGYEQVLNEMPITQGVSGRVARSGKPVLIGDVQTAPEFVGFRADIVSEVCVPLFDDRRVVGILNVESTQRLKLTESDLRLMVAVSDEIGIALGRARLYQELQENEEQYRLLFENSPVGIFVVDRSGKILAFNDVVIVPGKYTRADILDIGRLESFYFDPGSNSEIENMLNHAGRVNQYPARLKRKDGTPYDTLLTLVPARFSGQSSIQVMVEDVTQQKISEKALFEEQNRFRAIIENSFEGVTLLNKNGDIVYYSPSNEKITGYTAAERQGQGGFSTLHPDDLERVKKNLSEIAQAPGNIHSGVYRIRRKDGAWRWIEGVTQNLLSDPSVQAFVINIRDVTEQKVSEEKTLESEERFRQFSEASFEGIGITHGGTILDVNSRLAEMFGCDPIEMIGMNVSDFVAPEFREVVVNRIRSEALEPVEHIALRKDGSRFPVESRGRKMPYKGKMVRVTAIRDITERKRSETEIRSRLAELAAVNKISVAMRLSKNLEELLPRLLDETLAVLGTSTGSIYLYDSERNTLSEGLARGWCKGIVAATQRADEGIAGFIFATENAYVTREFSRDTAVLPPVRSQIPDGWGGACVPIRAAKEIIGVLMVSVQLPRELTADEVRLLTILAEIAGNAIHRAQLFDQSVRDASELALAYESTLEGWSHALDLRDRETEGHTLRVTKMVLDLGRKIGLSEAELLHVRRGALLHDIGKMSIPDKILHKKGPLSEAERKIMREHPNIARDMLSRIGYLGPAIDIPYCHHEKWDGSGYPRGLKGEQIPFGARIFSVVDVWDALLSDRPYRKAWDRADVIQYMISSSGIHFDPQVVPVFLQMVESSSSRKSIPKDRTIVPTP